MKYIKSFEIKKDNFKRDFKIGDIVICVDNSDVDLKIGKGYEVEYIINGKKSFVTIKDESEYYSSRDITRFIKPEDFEEWKIKDNINKYNL